jgi:uncharacterized protein YgiM (DUF1202 family)
MSYDPERTTKLPQIGFPITEELPIVTVGRGPGRRGPGSGFLKIAAVLLIASMIAIAAVLIMSNRESNEVASTNEAAENPTPAFEPEESPAPTPVELDDAEPGFWQVTGVPDGLNVRSGPGTDNDIVGTLRAGDRHIFGTGERVTVNGAEWTQIAFGDRDTVGWVSNRFLASDSAPGPNDPTPTPVVVRSLSVVCFQNTSEPIRIARLEFADSTAISGLIRTIDGQTAMDQTVSGTLANGSASMTLTDPSTGESSRRTWVFSPASVDLGNGIMLSVADCAAIAGQLP